MFPQNQFKISGCTAAIDALPCQKDIARVVFIQASQMRSERDATRNLAERLAELSILVNVSLLMHYFPHIHGLDLYLLRMKSCTYVPGALNLSSPTIPAPFP